MYKTMATLASRITHLMGWGWRISEYTSQGKYMRAGEQREPLRPFAVVPKTIGFGETHDGVDHGGAGEGPQALVRCVTCSGDEQIGEVVSRGWRAGTG